MPFAVSQWPYSPDPRTSDFNIFGWDFGQVPSWQWTVSTTGALWPYLALNDGVAVVATSFGRAFCFYNLVDTLPDNVVLVLTQVGTEALAGSSPPRTMSMDILTFGSTTPTSTGAIARTFPTAIQEHGPFTMVSSPIPATWFPNPLTIEPRKWNV